MGSLHDSDGPNEQIITNPTDNFSNAETQVFDSQFSPPPSPVEDTYETQVVSLDDETQALDLGGETQALNLGGETQALNLDGETQGLNLGDETQALNLGGETQALGYFDGFENMKTQVLDAFDNEVVNDGDNEGSDRTEDLGDGDCISDAYSARTASNQSLEKEKMQCASVCEQGDKDLRKGCDASNLGSHDSTATPVVQCLPQPEPGSVPRFTSIRAASLCASVLAARGMVSSEISSDPSYVLTNGLFLDLEAVRNNGLEQKGVEEIDRAHDFGKDNEKEKELRNENKCRVGSSMVRKLFAEDSLPEDKEMPQNSANASGGENLLQFPVYDGAAVYSSELLLNGIVTQAGV